jgi:hypothetical protein
MKYLEQRVEELEKEIQDLKIKLFQKEFEDGKKSECDTAYNPSLNLLSEPDLETAFSFPFEKTEIEKNPLNTITINTKNINDAVYPAYPNILDSWDAFPRKEDLLSEGVNEYGFKLNFNKNEAFENIITNKN